MGYTGKIAFAGLLFLMLIGLFVSFPGQATLAQTGQPFPTVTPAAQSSEVSIRVLDAGENQQISLRTAQSNLQQTLLLLETSNANSGQNISVNLRLSQLRTDANASAQFQINPASYTLTPGQAQEISLSGNLPEVGTYSGFLTLSYAGRVDVYNLSVTRATPPQILTVRASTPRFVHRLLPNLGTDIEVRVTLAETLGGKAAYYAPILQKLSQPAPGTTDGNDASYKDAQVRGRDNASLPLSQTLSLQPGQVAEYTLLIRDVKTGGQHQGTVEVTTPEGAKIPANFSFAIKDDLYFPALIIFLGIITSSFLRFYSNSGRPRLRRTNQISQIAGKIGEYLEKEDPLYPAFSARLQTIYVENQDGAGENIADELNSVTDKLQNYIYIRKVLLLKNNLTDYIPDSAKQAELSTDFRDIDRQLQAQKLDALNDTLKGQAQTLFNKLMQVSGQSLGDNLAKFSQNLQETLRGIENYAAVLGNGQDLPELQQTKAGFTELAQKVAKLVEKNNLTSGLEEKQAINEELRQQLVRYDSLSLEAFRATLKVAAPPGVDKVEWDKLRNQLLAEVTTPDKLAEAQRKCLHQMIEGLQKQLEQLEAGVAVRPDSDKITAKLNEFKTRLASNLSLMQTNLPAARNDYVEVVREFEVYSTQSGLMGGGNLPTAPGGIQIIPQMPTTAAEIIRATTPLRPLEETTIKIPPFKRISVQLLFGDGLAFIIIALVTVILGLQLLWAGKETFGTWEDYISVFLWGFGLHQLNQVALPAQVNSFNVPLSPTALGHDSNNSNKI